MTPLILFKILIVTFAITEIIRRPLFELKIKLKNKYTQFLLGKLYCWYCVTFWVTLGFTLDLFAASMMATISMVIQYGISIYKDYKFIQKNKKEDKKNEQSN